MTTTRTITPLATRSTGHAAPHGSRPAFPGAPAPPQTRGNTALLVVLGLLAGLGALGAYVLAVWTPTGQLLENQGLSAAQAANQAASQTGEPSTLLQVLALVGRPPLILATFGAVLLLGVATRRIRHGFAGVIVAAAAIAVTEMLKYGLPRPVFDGTDGSPMHNSFPSGHTAVAAGLSFGLILAAPTAWRLLIAVPAMLLTAVVAAGTVLAGWHRVSDTVGAVLVAAALFFLASAVVSLLDGRRGRAEAAPPPANGSPVRWNVGRG